MPAAKKPDELLRDAAARLKKNRPQMSMRAVAARLKISSSYWSKILHGEKAITRPILGRVVKVLGLDPHEVAELQRAILAGIENSRLAPATGMHLAAKHSPSPVSEYVNLGAEDFWLLEDWYLIPVLNCFGGRIASSPEEIARRLGISKAQVEKAISLFVAQGFLTKSESGKFERTERHVRFPTDRSHEAVRNYHLAMLKKSQEKLQRPDSALTFDARLVSSVNLSGSSEKLKEARLILEEALYRAANLLAAEPSPDQIYQLNIQLLPLLD